MTDKIISLTVERCNSGKTLNLINNSRGSCFLANTPNTFEYCPHTTAVLAKAAGEAGRVMWWWWWWCRMVRCQVVIIQSNKCTLLCPWSLTSLFLNKCCYEGSIVIGKLYKETFMYVTIWRLLNQDNCHMTSATFLIVLVPQTHPSKGYINFSCFWLVVIVAVVAAVVVPLLSIWES